MKLLVAAALIVACTSSRGDGPRDHPSADPATGHAGVAPAGAETQRAA